MTKRGKLKTQGKYNEADEVRKKIEEAGYEIRDTKDGVRLVKR